MNRSILTRRTQPVEESAPTQVQVDLNLCAAGDRVQYIGTEFAAYRGMIGQVRIVRGVEAAVLFDGVPTPVMLPQQDLIPGDDEGSSDPKAIASSKKPRVRYIANTSGGLLIIPDLMSESDKSGISMDAGEVLDLLQYFTAEQINRSRGLRSALATISTTTKMPQITELKSLDEPIPPGSVVKPLVDTVPPGTTIEAPFNEYDAAIEKSYREEDERNDKLKRESQSRRHDSRHGRGSTALGGR